MTVITGPTGLQLDLLSCKKFLLFHSVPTVAIYQN